MFRVQGRFTQGQERENPSPAHPDRPRPTLQLVPSGSAWVEVNSGLVGRDDELEELTSGLGDAVEGRGGLLLIAGEAGIGKTRLVEALLERGESSGARSEWGRCWEGGGGPAYWPWRQLIHALVAKTPTEVLADQLGSAAADVAQLAPELYQHLPGLEAEPPSESTDARARLFDGVISYLRSAARVVPLILALDDLHAADEPSLRLLLRLGLEVGSSRLLVVGTYRDDEVEDFPEQSRLLSRIARQGHLISLGGLAEREAARLVRGAAGSVIPEHLLRQVHDLADGNPFLTLECARQLSLGADADDLALPAEAQALIRRRLQLVDGSSRDLMGRAALLGREFDLTTLTKLDGRPATALLDHLEQAEHSGIVRRAGLGQWSFVHALFREALYEDLDPSQRVALHQRAGEAIEELRGGDASAWSELARHFCEAAPADNGQKAVRYCRLAGQAATRSLAFEEAARLYERAIAALTLAPAVVDAKRYELWAALGEARYRAGALPEAREAYREAMRAARALGAPDLLAQAALGFAGMYESAQGVDELGIRVLEEALAGLPEEDSPVRARLLVALAGRRLADGVDWDLTGPVSRQGLDMARRVGDAPTLQAVLWEWHRNAYFIPETLEERIRVADELVDLATRARNREWLIWALEWRSADRFEVGDIPGMVSDLDAAVREAEHLRLPFLIWGATFQKVAVALLGGQFDDAERLADEALAIGERTEFIPVEMNHLGQLMAIRRQQGRFEELEQLARRHAEKFAWEEDDSRMVVVALVLAERGRRDEARSVFDRCAATAFSHFAARGLRVMSVVADVCWLLDDRDRAAPTYEAMLPHAGRHAVDGIAAYSLGASDRSLGQMATLLEHWDAAEAHFAAAHRLHERWGARVWAAHTQADEARMLLLRRRPGDAERADGLLRRAEAAYRSLGMTPYLSRLDQLSERLAATTDHERTERGRWVREGEGWTVTYGGTLVRLLDSKGMDHLSHLLRHPNQPIPAVELAGTGSAPGDEERARQAVTRALRSAIDRIAAAHPALGAHLRTTVRIGTHSSYVPDPRAPVRWDG